MIQVKMIFIGLIAFAPLDSGDWLAVLTEEMPGHDTHAPIIVQIEGKCEGDCQFCGAPEELMELLEENDLKSSSGSLDLLRTCLMPPKPPEERKLQWVPIQTEVTWLEHSQADVTNDLDDHVISVKEMVPFGASLRPSCRKKCVNCRLTSRVRIVEGTLKPCHYIHHPIFKHKRITYDINGRERPVANIVSLEFSMERDESLYLTGKTYGREDRVQAELSPKSSNKITLIILNEPLVGLGSTGVPETLKHFKAFYSILHPIRDFFGTISSKVPRRVGEVDGFPGSCEKYLYERDRPEGVDSTLWRRLMLSAPHGPAECDVATIP